MTYAEELSKWYLSLYKGWTPPPTPPAPMPPPNPGPLIQELKQSLALLT